MATKLSERERFELTRQALVLQQEGLCQRKIAAKLQVSQPTVCQWLKRHREGDTTAGQRAAAKIREELVCCDIYQRMEDAYDPEDSGWKALRHSRHWHCFYGEWAARIAEAVK